jgi:hypothetical protein
MISVVKIIDQIMPYRVVFEMIRTLPPASMLDLCCGSTEFMLSFAEALTNRCACTERSRSVEVGTELIYRENMIFLCVSEPLWQVLQIMYGLVILKNALLVNCYKEMS